MSYRRGYQDGALETFHAVEQFLDPAVREIVSAWIEQDVNGWRLKAMLGYPPTWRLTNLSVANRSQGRVTDCAEIAEPALSDGEMLRISVKHQAPARDQWNLQQAAPSFESLTRDALNERMTFEHRGPNGWEIFSLPHQFGAHVREIIRSF